MSILEAIAAGLGYLALKADAPDDAFEGPENTWDLPEGEPLREALEAWFGQQAEKVLGTLPTIGSPIPEEIEPLGDDEDMARAMTPLVSAYWDQGGRTTRERLGLDPDDWRVIDPHVEEKIRGASLAFCQSTNQTTTLRLNDALDRLREELVAGIVTEGDTVRQLRRRVQAIFTSMGREKAEQIARTETSRAVHAASLESAKESGVVSHKVWLASADACDVCLGYAADSQKRPTPLADEFAHVGDHPEYSSIQSPPAHPYCMCSVVYELTPAYKQILEADGPPFGDAAPGPMGPNPETTPPQQPLAERFPGLTIRPSEVEAFTKGSAYKGTMIHRCSIEKRESILVNGIDVERSSGYYGRGLYASTRAEKGFGEAEIQVALHVKNPLTGTKIDIERKLADWCREDGLDPTKDRFAVNKAIEKRGYDAVIFTWEKEYKGPDSYNWIAIIKPETARFIMDAAPAPAKPGTVPPLLPGRPIAERLAAYETGDIKLWQVKALEELPPKWRQEARDLQQQMKAEYARVYAANRNATDADLTEALRLQGLYEKAYARANGWQEELRKELTKLLQVDKPLRVVTQSSGAGSPNSLPQTPGGSATRAHEFLRGVVGRGPTMQGRARST